MPIVLIDRRAPQRIAFGGASITLYEASGDRVLAEIRRGARAAHASPDTATEASTEAAVRLVAGCVTDWSGVEDATGAAIPWPDAGAAVGVAGVPEPSASALAARRALLALLPWDVLSRLDAAAARSWEAAQGSGKGSETA